MKLNLSQDKIKEQRAKVNAIRDSLEIAPVTVTISTGTYIADCDPLSVNRMADSLMLWSTFGIASIDWVMADNSVVALSEAELSELHFQVIAQRGIRSAQLHAYAGGIKATLPIPDNSTQFEGDTWLT